ncbi:phage terminase small subunit [Luteibacter sp. NPDC031894]|uniref:phage terminase small subunit n=1 Tax=Luteibacter sp. NPDC031894 TaxID=3390572 RepID=UPI003D014DC3
MASPAQLHRTRVLAAQAAAKAAPGPVMTNAEANVVSLMYRKLDEDRRRLKAIESIERKIQTKRELLPDYEPYIEGVLAGGVGERDEIVSYVLAWRFDVGDYASAFDLAEYVIAHGLGMPDAHARSAPAFIADEVADAALRAFKSNKEFERTIIERAMAVTDGCDMPDQAKAKLYKALGYAYRAEELPDLAVAALRRAIELDETVGVKRDIELLERQLRNAGKPGPTEQSPAGGT